MKTKKFGGDSSVLPSRVWRMKPNEIGDWRMERLENDWDLANGRNDWDDLRNDWRFRVCSGTIGGLRNLERV
ncbi:hypothetical protein A2U01_0003685 [Trifolium medium]|uniref:Uncharacterized protein n=1 Tax=Trifolium medium TaxID=97028 RepID=A0A392M623_9FABA|nr:hypothetical protein [Trifolium medium]